MKKTSVRAVACLLLLAGTVTCALAQDQDVEETRIIVLRGSSDELEAALRKEVSFPPQMEQRFELRVGTEARGDVEVEAHLLPSSGLGERLAGLPVELADDRIVLGTTVYRDPAIALALRLPRAARPSWVVVGWQVEAVANLAERVVFGAAGLYYSDLLEEYDYLLVEPPWSKRHGRWQQTETGFAVDPDERDEPGERVAAHAAAKPLARRGIVLRVPPERAADPALARLADELEAAVLAMAPRLPVTLDRPLEAFVETDYVTQARHHAAVGAALVDDDGGLLLVFHKGDLDTYRYGVARALLRRAGFELPPWLEDGAALWLSGGWYGRPFTDWLPDFAFAQVLPEAAELLATERQEDGSDVLWPPAAAAVIASLEGETLAAKLEEPPGEAAVSTVLRKLRDAAPVAATLPKAPATASFFQGVSLAMQPSIDDAYHSPNVDDKLALLSKLGVTSVAVMPYAFLHKPDEPRLHSRVVSPKDETEPGLLHATRRAHARDFRVLWKPHVFVWSSWPGEIFMKTEDDWAAWWRAYRRYIVHQAVLARFAGAELFSVGVELGRTVEREAEWRQTIAAVRRVYPGLLTYSGNWWGDWDRVPFWDALDFVGIDAYFPLGGPEAGRPELLEGAKKVVADLRSVAERVGKPVILTELGFAARKAPWVSPHEETYDSTELSTADQHLAYEVFFEALGRPEWLGGMFLWKVYSNSQGAAEDDPFADFRFVGRPAEEVVRRYFTAAE